MKAFLVVCLLSAVSLANAARSLRSRGGARAGLNGRLYAGAESAGPTGAPGVTYSLGGQASGQIGAQAGTGIGGPAFAPWSEYGGTFGPAGAGFYPGAHFGYPGGYGLNGNYGWGSPYPTYGAYGSPWGGAYGSSYYPYGAHGYGYGGYPQGFFGRNYYNGNLGGNTDWNARGGPGPFVRSGPLGAPAAGPPEAATVSGAPAAASGAAASTSS